ncbi:MAG: amidohydrolase family protein [Hyphomonadaceae bacterium]|nr:amidohydrolase family protein [Hyphomonadaceae bacterium]
MSAQRLDWLISCDDHIMEPPNLWLDRLPAKYKDRAPRVIQVKGNDFWEYEGAKRPMLGLLTAMGRPKEDWTPEPTTYVSMRPGCYDVKARIADMDQAGILGSLNFGTIPGFTGELFRNAEDKNLGLLCIQAWNDWLFEEWVGAAPGRFIPNVLLPLWDVKLATAELERCAAKGARAFAFPELLDKVGLPTLNDRSGYWNPLMAAAEQAEIVVCMHQGTGGKRNRFAEDAPEVATMAWAIGATSSGCMLDWLFSPMFHRFPRLKIALSEGGVGWMPYFLERAEEVLNNHRYWAAKGNRRIDHTTQSLGEAEENLVDFMTLDIRKLYHDHVYGCFIKDEAGIATIDILGEDNICIETDFPHSDSKWPNCIQFAHSMMRGLSDGQKYKVLRGNAERIYRFTPAEPPFEHKI